MYQNRNSDFDNYSTDSSNQIPDFFSLFVTQKDLAASGSDARNCIAISESQKMTQHDKQEHQDDAA